MPAMSMEPSIPSISLCFSTIALCSFIMVACSFTMAVNSSIMVACFSALSSGTMPLSSIISIMP